MPHRYSTALSHFILAGMGLFCLAKTSSTTSYLPHVTFGIIALNSLIGVWRWGNPDYGDKCDSLYKFTSLVQSLFSLPCITTSVFLAYGYDPYLSWAFTVLPVVSLLCYLLHASTDGKVEERILVAINLTALGLASIAASNYWGIADIVSFAILFVLLHYEDTLEEIPAQDLYNYGLCFFAYFALRAIAD